MNDSEKLIITYIIMSHFQHEPWAFPVLKMQDKVIIIKWLEHKLSLNKVWNMPICIKQKNCDTQKFGGWDM